MFSRILNRQGRVSRRAGAFSINAVIGLIIASAASGCGSSEAPSAKSEPASESANATVSAQTPVAPAAAEEVVASISVDEAKSEPVSVTQPVSPEQQEAEAAFRTMTSEGISPEDLEAAIDKLLAIGKPAVPVLAEGLQSDDSLQREMAATVLAQFGASASAAADELVAALQDESPFVRANAATALAQMEGQAERVTPVFTEFLEGDDEHLRRMAAMNLSVLDVSAVKPLVGKLSEALKVDDRETRLAIIELLGRIGPDASDAIDAIKAIDTADDAELKSAVDAALMQIQPDSDP